MNYIKQYTDDIRKSFYLLVENISLEERKVDLDKYYVDTAKDLCNELKLAIIDYEESGKSNKLIKLNTGWAFIPEDSSFLPNFYLDKRNVDTYGKWLPKLNAIVLYILDDTYNIDDITKQYISNILENVLIHELAHYYNDSAKKGTGRSLRIQNYNSNNQAYYNDKEEMDAITKELENTIYTDLKQTLDFAKQTLTIDDQCNFINDALRSELYYYKNNKNSEFNKFLTNLTQENLKKVYKDIYNYCINEYLKSFNPYQNNLGKKLKSKLYNSDAMNAWFKQHKF